MVAIGDDGGAMGDEDDGALLVGEEVGEELTLRFGIQGAGGFVEEHDAAGT